MIYMLCLVSLLIPVTVLQVRWAYHRRQLMKGSWHNVFTGVEKVDIEGIRTIAEFYLQSDDEHRQLRPEEMWAIVGGFEGLTRLRRNATVILNLAIFSERWDRTEASGVSEQIRRDALRLDRAVTRIRIRLFFGVGLVRSSSQLQEAVASYYILRSRLIGQYQATYGDLVPRLEAAL